MPPHLEPDQRVFPYTRASFRFAEVFFVPAALMSLVALSASASESKPIYAAKVLPEVVTDRPRRLMPASATARIIRAPMPRVFGPSTRRVARFSPGSAP